MSGAIHVVGCLAQAAGQTTYSFPLLCLSRVIHGYTLLLFPLTVIWIGARQSAEQRPLSLAARNQWSTMGIFSGVLAGSLLASFAPSSLLAGMAPGALNVVVSLAMLGWIVVAFEDREP